MSDFRVEIQYPLPCGCVVKHAYSINEITVRHPVDAAKMAVHSIECLDYWFTHRWNNKRFQHEPNCKENTLSTDSQIEKDIQDKGLVAPRVTPTDIEAAIENEHYFTAEDGADSVNAVHAPEKPWRGEHLRLLTLCVLVLKNGFTVVGKSACASPENFDAELGRKIARQDAINQMWPLLGYALKEKLAQGCDRERPAPVSPPRFEPGKIEVLNADTQQAKQYMLNAICACEDGSQAQCWAQAYAMLCETERGRVTTNAIR